MKKVILSILIVVSVCVLTSSVQKKKIPIIVHSKTKIETVPINKPISNQPEVFFHVRPQSPQITEDRLSELDVSVDTNEYIDDEIVEIDREIEEGHYIERANKNLLPDEERKQLHSLFNKRSIYFKEKLLRILNNPGV